MKKLCLQFPLIFFLSGFAHAAGVFGLDPLCDVSIDVKKELERSRPLHLKFPQYRDITTRQTNWFTAVNNDMVNTCLADKKFAEEILKRDRGALTGQCKPAAEAALYDKELLEFAEKRVNDLKQKKLEFLAKGGKSQESLAKVFDADFARVGTYALDLGDSPRETACELRWLYPREFLKKRTPFAGCQEAPPGVKLPGSDKDDPGVFARLITRYSRSIEYNSERRNNAAATAKASQARYEECIAKFPGTENVLVKAASATGSKPTASVSAGKEKTPRSTITGVEEDKKKTEKIK
jgi:hypothetical protein